MQQQPKNFFFLWILVVLMIAGVTFLLFQHVGTGVVSKMVTLQRPDTDTNNDGTAASGTAPVAAASPVPMQDFSNDGYSFSVPARWSIERTGSETIAVHPDAASPDAGCKIEINVFPPVADGEDANWIAQHIGADPSLAIVERSSNEVSFASGVGVEWTGTIDGVQTTLVYAFNATHAYEIAPSGGTQCGDMLQTLLSDLAL